jgi:hypothetical protein
VLEFRACRIEVRCRELSGPNIEFRLQITHNGTHLFAVMRSVSDGAEAAHPSPR